MCMGSGLWPSVANRLAVGRVKFLLSVVPMEHRHTKLGASKRRNQVRLERRKGVRRDGRRDPCRKRDPTRRTRACTASMTRPLSTDRTRRSPRLRRSKRNTKRKQRTRPGRRTSCDCPSRPKQVRSGGDETKGGWRAIKQCRLGSDAVMVRGNFLRARWCLVWRGGCWRPVGFIGLLESLLLQ